MKCERCGLSETYERSLSVESGLCFSCTESELAHLRQQLEELQQQVNAKYWEGIRADNVKLKQQLADVTRERDELRAVVRIQDESLSKRAVKDMEDTTIADLTRERDAMRPVVEATTASRPRAVVSASIRSHRRAVRRV